MQIKGPPEGGRRDNKGIGGTGYTYQGSAGEQNETVKGGGAIQIKVTQRERKDTIKGVDAEVIQIKGPQRRKRIQ